MKDRAEGIPSVRDSPEAAETTASPSVARATLEVVLLVLGAALGLWVLYRLKLVLLLLVLAAIFAYLLVPLIRVIRRPISARGRSFVLPLPLAIGVVYVAILGSVTTAVILLLPVMSMEISELAKQAPAYVARVEDQWHVWQASYQIRVLPGEVREAVDRAMTRGATAAETYVTSDLLPRIGDWLIRVPWLILVPVLAFFLLKDGELLRDSALHILPRGRLRSRGVKFLGELNESLAAYTRAQVTACLLIGVVCTAAFLIIGVPYAVVLGIAAGALEFIPMAGPLAIGLLAVGFAAFHSPALAIGVLIFLLVLRAVQDYVVYPRIMGRGLHMHPLAVILAILCGGSMGGFVGVFLAIPAAVVLTVAYRHYRAHQAAEPLVEPG